MIKIFYGNDRVKAQAAIRQWLGNDYEVVEGAELDLAAMADVFWGRTLFAEKRKIVIKDLAENKDLLAKLADYVETEHEVALFENALDKRTKLYKDLTALGVEIREFKLAEQVDMRAVFDIYDTAMRDGVKALKMLEKVEMQEDPFMFVGLMTTQAIRIFEMRGGEREKRNLKKLAELDLQMKNTSINPWMLVKGFLLNL